MPEEVEIKFAVGDLAELEARLRQLGFNQHTPRTHEMNTLYDRRGALRRRGELLRIRQYGDRCVLTHKSKGASGRHKTRIETETAVGDAGQMHLLLAALGYQPSFRYEKFRSEWGEGAGHVLLDETPIGNFAEIEGAPQWIDDVAGKLGIAPEEYITANYAELFRQWQRRTGAKAEDMTFAEIAKK